MDIVESQDVILCPTRLLDKLLVVCPNGDACEEVVPRSHLKNHLVNKCQATCSHDLRLLSEIFPETREHVSPDSALMPHLPIVDGEITTLEIQRGCYDLGISIVGGIDTPLPCVVIQEIFPDGVVARDGRLRSGDQIVECNGVHLSGATHVQAKQALRLLFHTCRLSVFREKPDVSAGSAIRTEELNISLTKQLGQQLGVKLATRRATSGVYVLEVMTGSVAERDGRLRPDDRIVEVNCQDLRCGTQEQAAAIISASLDKVQLSISRRTRPDAVDFPPETRLAERRREGRRPARRAGRFESAGRERHVIVKKASDESLGISVSGGLGSARGDVPVYITNIQPDGPLDRTQQVKKGDVIVSVNEESLLELTHVQAVRALKSCGAGARTVALRLIEGRESLDGVNNFVPTWKFWLSLPPICMLIQTVSLRRTAEGTLGFSIVGGAASSDPIFVRCILPDGPAWRAGGVKSGDQLIAVDSISLEGASHDQAVSLLTRAGDKVSLDLVSWPGTIV